MRLAPVLVIFLFALLKSHCIANNVTINNVTINNDWHGQKGRTLSAIYGSCPYFRATIWQVRSCDFDNIEVCGGQTILISVCSSVFPDASFTGDPYIRLYFQSGDSVLATGDNECENNGPMISYTFPTGTPCQRIWLKEECMAHACSGTVYFSVSTPDPSPSPSPPPP